MARLPGWLLPLVQARERARVSGSALLQTGAEQVGQALDRLRLRLVDRLASGHRYQPDGLGDVVAGDVRQVLRRRFVPAHDESFVMDVPVEEVRSAALELLALGCAEPTAPGHNSLAGRVAHARR